MGLQTSEQTLAITRLEGRPTLQTTCLEDFPWVLSSWVPFKSREHCENVSKREDCRNGGRRCVATRATWKLARRMLCPTDGYHQRNGGSSPGDSGQDDGSMYNLERR